MSDLTLLSQVPLFSALGPEDLEQLAARVRTRHCERGEILFHRGDVGTDLYVIREGEVTIRLSAPDGREVSLALLRKGAAFGELALLDQAPRSTDAVAHEESWLLSLRSEDFRLFLRERPQAVLTVLPMLSRLVRRVTQAVYGANVLDARSRLARVLLDLAEQQGQPSDTGVSLASRLTQTELASLCGLTRESTNRWLRFYASEGLLTYEGGVITLLDLKDLSANVE